MVKLEDRGSERYLELSGSERYLEHGQNVYIFELCGRRKEIFFTSNIKRVYFIMVIVFISLCYYLMAPQIVLRVCLAFMFSNVLLCIILSCFPQLLMMFRHIYVGIFVLFCAYGNCNIFNDFFIANGHLFLPTALFLTLTAEP